MIEPVVRLPLQETGRTLVCGDIHGCFSLLEEKLKEVGFDASVDRVICVGDLIDRGPESIRALEFLDAPWFYSVMGNHEHMLLDVLSGNISMESTWLREGGSWFYEQVPESARAAWVERLSKLPILIEIETVTGLVGVVHADIPRGVSWQRFVRLVQDGNPAALAKALKSRFRVSSRLREHVPGVTKIYCGHTYVAEPRLQANVWCIDTGAYMGEGSGTMTLMDVADQMYPEPGH